MVVLQGDSEAVIRGCSVKKVALRNFPKFTGLRPATLLKRSLWHRCFPVNFAKFRDSSRQQLTWCFTWLIDPITEICHSWVEEAATGSVLKKFTKFIGKHLCLSLFFNKVQASDLQLYLKRDSIKDVFLRTPFL